MANLHSVRLTPMNASTSGEVKYVPAFRVMIQMPSADEPLFCRAPVRLANVRLERQRLLEASRKLLYRVVCDCVLLENACLEGQRLLEASRKVLNRVVRDCVFQTNVQHGHLARLCSA